ncbi:hypothetical protein RN001_000728 [Aquatica leii]|uniref:BESS domain-containing protein n=1 Tax=Aquatica leii TaxID=1421715 RepID=A0AAN7PFA9_9COLE|nr:hypothetical protein RN001_000728 [Aquatica leii]
MAENREVNNHKNPELIRLLQSIAKSESATIYSNLNTCEWTTEETNFLLKVLTEYEYFSQIRSNDEHIYGKLSKIMDSNGYKKSSADIKKYWIELEQNLLHCKSDEFLNKSGNHNNELLDTETNMVIIKGEEFDNSALESQESLHSFYEEFEQKTGKCIRKNNWTYKETECVVEVLEKYGMPNRSNLRKFCCVVVEHLKQNGFLRSDEQAQIKMKHLRGLYNQVIRKTLKEDDFPFFSRIKEVMQTNVSSNKLSENEDTRNFIAVEELSKSTKLDDSNVDIHEEDNNTKRGRQIWTNKEVQVLLRFIEENNIVTGKQLRKICAKAVDHLASYGYIRSPTQILIRWKNTKAVYWATFRKKLLHPERECTFFYQLHNILNPEDKSYESRILDVGEDDDLATRNFEITTVDATKISEGIHFPLNKTCNNQPDNYQEDNFTSHQNSSNSSDNFVNVHNSVTPKRLTNAEELADPLQNTSSIDVIPSSPKRSRTEPTRPSLLSSSCTSCNILDSVDHYCISLAHSIKRLDSRKQAKLKIEIQQLMYKAEFDSNF